MNNKTIPVFINGYWNNYSISELNSMYNFNITPNWNHVDFVIERFISIEVVYKNGIQSQYQLNDLYQSYIKVY